MNSTVNLLRRALSPQSVAVIGASADPAKFGGRVMHFLIQHGYAGRIVPVNRSADEILGLPAVPTISAAAQSVDIALLAVPTAHVAIALEECGKAGVPCAVIITSDFAELGAEGAAKQEELVRIARASGMRLIGPNCLGFINPHINLALTSSVALAVKPMPRGTIGLISQSGSLMATMISHAQDLGAGVSVAASIGNQADLDACDFIEYFLVDDRTRAICLYLEGIKDGRRFLALADRCSEAGKPLLVVKAGRSTAGAAITQSHTASLAGSHEVWLAACREHAICVLDDPEAMLQCAHLLTGFGAPASNRVAVISPSGGTVAVTCDRLHAAGLPLSPLSAATRKELAQWFPPSRPFNPLDIGGLPREQSMTASVRAYELVARDPEVGIVFVVVATTPQLDEKVRCWGEAALAIGKPTIMLLAPGSLVDGARATLREMGCPFVNRMDDALKIMRAAVDYGAALRVIHTPATPLLDAAAVQSAAARLPAGRPTETQIKQLLRVCGIHTTEDIVATDVEGAVRAAQTIGFPVVMKAVCRELVHKSDIGAVQLDVRDAAAVRAAWHTINSNVHRHLPQAQLDGCVVQPMLSGGTEIMLGAKWDAQFGAVVIAGAGGILVEVLQDVATVLAPLSLDRAHTLIRGLRIWPILAGARGRPPADVTALADALTRLSELAAMLGPQLVELDINPLLVRTQGQGVIALDARATLNTSTTA